MHVHLLTLSAKWYICLLQNVDFSGLIHLFQRFMAILPLTSEWHGKSNTRLFGKLHQQHCGIKCQHMIWSLPNLYILQSFWSNFYLIVQGIKKKTQTEALEVCHCIKSDTNTTLKIFNNWVKVLQRFLKNTNLSSSITTPEMNLVHCLLSTNKVLSVPTKEVINK